MKYLLITILMLISSYASAENSCQVITQDVNTPVPAELKDKEICIRDSKTGKLDCSKSTNEYKIVKRKQQFKVKEVKTIAPEVVYFERIVEVKAKEKRNLVSLGLRSDYIGLDRSVTSNSATITKETGPVFDLNYFRRMMFDSSLGLGIGIDTNRTIRGSVGVEF